MAKVNGNDGNTPDLKNLQAYYEAIKAKATSKTGKTDKIEGNNQVPTNTFDFGIGSKTQAQQIAGLEVEGLSKIPEEDVVQLTELYKMAGIKSPIPTKQVYERIGTSVTQVGDMMTRIETENNATELFNSSEFKVLDDIFFG